MKTMVDTNSSDYISRGVFSTFGDDKLLHFRAFFFKNLNLAKCNYKISKKFEGYYNMFEVVKT